jgi:DNA-binding CsgD family transcriptional regulator
LAMHIHEKVRELSFVSPLAPRELQCVQRLALGRVPKVIADELGISESAVRKYLGTAVEKLGCQNATHLVAAAVARGLIAVD